MEFKKIEDYKYYNLSVFMLGSGEWVIGTEKKFRVAAKEKMLEDLWMYDADHICKFLREKQVFGNEWSGYDWDKFKQALDSIQGKMCEDANPIITAFIGTHIDTFIKEMLDDDDHLYRLGDILARYNGSILSTEAIKGLNRGYGPLCFRLT